MVTKDDFLDWKKNPVTQAFFHSLVEKINLGATELSYGAGNDPKEDRFKCGILHAYRAILEIEIDEIEGASDNA